MSPHIRSIVFLSLGLLLVFAWHFGTVFGFFGNAPATRGEFFIRVGVIFVIFLAISGITAVLVAKHTGFPPEPDEREERILLKTEQIGMATVYAGLLLLAWLVFTPFSPMQMANAILAVICVAELVKIVYGLAVLKRKI